MPLSGRKRGEGQGKRREGRGKREEGSLNFCTDQYLLNT
jgi:hypothetical protein